MPDFHPDILQITLAADEAVTELVSADTLDAQVWTPALQGATRSDVLQVRRLDRVDEFYYIVPFLKSGLVTARLVVDAQSLEVEEIGAIETEGQSLMTFADPLVVLSRQAEAGLWISPEPIPPAPPSLGWKDCLESRSALLPFYVVTVGGQTVYVRVDGEFFPSLTEAPDA